MLTVFSFFLLSSSCFLTYALKQKGVEGGRKHRKIDIFAVVLVFVFVILAFVFVVLVLFSLY